MDEEVTQAVAENRIVVVGMKQNPFVKKARKTPATGRDRILLFPF